MQEDFSFWNKFVAPYLEWVKDSYVAKFSDKVPIFMAKKFNTDSNRLMETLSRLGILETLVARKKSHNMFDTHVLNLENMKLDTLTIKDVQNVQNNVTILIVSGMPMTLKQREMLELRLASNSEHHLEPLQSVPSQSHYDHAEYNIAISMIPKKSPKIFRLMTYNVQEWRNLAFSMISWATKHADYRPKIHDSFDKTVSIIKGINPDVLGIQETSKDEDSEIQHESLKAFGYQVHTCDADQGWFSQLQNGLFVRPKLTSHASISISKGLQVLDPRCMTVVAIVVNKIEITVATLHLSYKDGRKMPGAIQAIAYLDNLKKDNIVLMGDFNSHYGDEVYNFITEKYHDSAILNIKQRQESLRWLGPSVYGGSRIDFIFLKKTWDFLRLPMVGSYVHYNFESDHFPVILDLQML